MPGPLPDLIDAPTALAALGVKPQTLYAYVSRGLIRSVGAGARNASLYYREDVEGLQMRGRTRRATENAAQRALRVGGGAVMQTAITDITERGPRYRGQFAADLVAAGRSFEQCAELLWSGLLPEVAPRWDPPSVPDGFDLAMRAARQVASRTSSRQLLSLGVESWAACVGHDPELAAAAPILAARDVLHVMTGCIGLLRARPAFTPARPGQGIAHALARSLGVGADEDQVRLLDAALVLCADHELAPPTFAARVAASAGADIHACITSALGAFEGMGTGIGCDLAERLLRSSRSPRAYVAALAATARQQRPLAGYNHPLYAEGDPRALVLIELVAGVARKGSAGAMALRCQQAARDELGAQPGINMALSVLSIVLGHPLRAPAAVMALGRSAGWVAHAHEQRMAGFLVRPRAKYVGR